MIKQIKADLLKSRKERNSWRTTILTTLLSEIEIVGKNDGNRETTDAEAIKVITKFKKGVEDVMSRLTVETMDRKYIAEAELYDSYLPKMMTEDELRSIVTAWKETNYPDTPNIGGYMSALKRCYDGQYDGKVASKVVREALSE